MTVGELIELLQKEDPEREVIISMDSEGNEFSPLSDYSPELYVPDSTWSGEIYLEELTEEDIENGYTEDDVYDGTDGVKAIVLWPIR